MKRLLLLLAIACLCLGQMCAPPPNEDTNGGTNDDGTSDVGEPGDDNGNDAPKDPDTGGDDDGDAGTNDPPDDTPPPVDSGDDDGAPDDGAGDDTGDPGDDVTDPPPDQGGGGGGGGGDTGGGDDTVTGPCSGVDYTGTWTDGDRLFTLTHSGNTLASKFDEPFVCDHEDGEGTTSTTDEDFTATLSGDCTLTGTITVCRFGCTAEVDDCSVDENGVATVPFEGEASELGDAISIDFVDPLTGDSFSLLYTLEP